MATLTSDAITAVPDSSPEDFMGKTRSRHIRGAAAVKRVLATLVLKPEDEATQRCRSPAGGEAR